MAKVAELVVRVAIRGNLATYKWDGQLPFDRDVTSRCKPPNPRCSSEPTWLLVRGLKAIGMIADFQFDSAELMLKGTSAVKWDTLNKALQKLLVSVLPGVKQVKLVSDSPVFEVKGAGSSRVYTPPSGSRFSDVHKLKDALVAVNGIVVQDVRDKRVIVGLKEHISWGEPHVDVVLVLTRFCR